MSLDAGKKLAHYVVAEPRPLFEGPYDGGTGFRGSQTCEISPDGERFLMLKPSQSAEECRFIVVLNWTDELRRLVSNE